MKKSSFSIPKFPNTKYFQSYLETEWIVYTDNSKNIYLRLTSDIIYKYNVSGKQVAKTQLSTQLIPLHQKPDEKNIGLIYTKYDSKIKKSYFYLYRYR